MNARDHLAHLTAYDALFDAVFPGVIENLTAESPLSPLPGRLDLGGGSADGISTPMGPVSLAAGEPGSPPPSPHLRLVKSDGAA